MGAEVADYLQTLKNKSKVGGLPFPCGLLNLRGSSAIAQCVSAARSIPNGDWL
jgi:hypothetical protein